MLDTQRTPGVWPDLLTLGSAGLSLPSSPLMNGVVPSTRIPNPYSWNSPNNPLIRWGVEFVVLAEAEEVVKPYKYSRTFEAANRERPMAEMDKATLSAYIKEILGSSDPESSGSQMA